MKVAHIVGKLKAAGVESVVFNYLRNMDLSGIETDVLYDSDSTVSPPEDLVEAGIRFIVIPPYQKLPSYISKIKELCRENGYDIVHSHMNALSGFPLYAAKRGGVKHRIAHNHSTSSKAEGKRDLAKRILRPFARRYATDYAACSEKAGRWLFGDRSFDSGEVTIFNNAIDIGKFAFNPAARAEVRSELGIGESFVLLHIGRFVKQKNTPFIIDIFKELKTYIPDAKLLLIGDGELLEETKKKVSDYTLYESVIFKGVVPDTHRYYSAADAFVLPSLYEGLPVVALEAQASGLDVYVSDAVTAECAVTPNVSFISLDDGEAAWAKEISSAKPCDRGDGAKIMKGSAFDIDKSANDMRDYHLSLVKNSSRGGKR